MPDGGIAILSQAPASRYSELLTEAIRQMPGRFVEVPESFESNVTQSAARTFSASMQGSLDRSGMPNLEHLKELVAEAHKQHEKGNKAATVELLRQVLTLAPANAGLLTRLARMFHALGEAPLAREAAERATVLDANDTETFSMAVREGVAAATPAGHGQWFSQE